MSTHNRMPAGVAAGHPDTARIGRAVLAAGGSAGDSVAAMILAGCVSETIFTGLGGGGFATHFDAHSGEVTCHDFFVAVPGLDGSTPAAGRGISVSFGGVAVPYDVGGATVAVPGTPVGVEALHRAHGRLPWAQVVMPARDLALTGSSFVAAHADLLRDVAAAMVLGAGADAYVVAAPDGSTTLLSADDQLMHIGLAATLDILLESGAQGLMTGAFGHAFVAAVREDGGALSLLDMASYTSQTRKPRTVDFGDATLHLRGNDLDDVAGTLARLDKEALRADDASRALALVAALQGQAVRSDTTSVVAVDRDGNACAATHSLGLGSGIWVAGVHGNSMLGEGELLRGALVPGERMGSMMSPLVATNARGELVFAGGAAGGSRIRAALLQVLGSVLVEGMELPQAIARPRLAVGGSTVHLEPGFAPGVAEALAAAAYDVRHWDGAKPYFGGVSAASVTGPSADPRRGGLALLL
ncbi:gamma-glutamyltransferase [Nakamurella antarctica]|nr:gamma-glutamyltransferase [Nakamurella antarctica]